MKLLGPRHDRNGESTNNGLRQHLAETVETHQVNKEDHFNSADWSAALASEAAGVRAEMQRRSRSN